MLANLGELLERTAGRFIVPAYQRRYVWGREAAQRMCGCVQEMLRTGQPLFISGITLCRLADGRYEIVDGQQRLTFFRLLLEHLGLPAAQMTLDYECRTAAQQWMQTAIAKNTNINAQPCHVKNAQSTDTQDVALFKITLSVIQKHFPDSNLLAAVLQGVTLLCLEIDKPALAVAAFNLMNGTKSPMATADVIKADLMRLASQASASPQKTEAMRSRYANEWEDWARWWNRADVCAYYANALPKSAPPISLLLSLCLYADKEQAPYAEAPTYADFHSKVSTPLQAKQFFDKLHYTQMRVQDAYANPEKYNRIKAIMLLLPHAEVFRFLHAYFVEASIDASELTRYYKLAFLGMTLSDIAAGVSPMAKFDELIANLSMADVYHSDAKRDAYNLLLRLNIDEDIKLGRKFDFSIWTNRSLEHIYSKSKVWHLGQDDQPLDGNDSPLRVPVQRLQADKSFLYRDDIVNADGVRLSEHCIGNLVLLYGDNNSAFGNTTFDEKKAMFLSPVTIGSFQSRNLLHSVCVFACKEWTGQSIVDNYNLTLKNLKLYYGYK